MTDKKHDHAVAAGFKYGTTGPHNSRTMMLEEISRCLDHLPATASREAYRVAIVEENLLGKSTESTRRESFRRLRELYGIDVQVPLYRLMRELDALDPDSRPLLALLTVCARDPLLRATAHVVLDAQPDSPIETQLIDDALAQAFPTQNKPAARLSTARHLSSTWSQSGHLTGDRPKLRSRVEARPAAMALALFMSALEEVHCPDMFTSFWSRMLDLNALQAQALASQAHREGLINLFSSGGVVEVSFPRFSDILKACQGHEPL